MPVNKVARFVYLVRMSISKRLIPALAAVVLAACSSQPPYQGMGAADLYDLALRQYQAGEYQDAIRALDRLFVAYGGWEQMSEARLLMGHAYFAKEEYLTAQSEYQRFVDRYPAHPEASNAALGICRSLSALSPNPHRDQTYTEEAITVCRNVVLDYAGTPASLEAGGIANAMRLKLAEKEYLNADFYFRREMYDSAIKYFEFVVDLYPETEWAPRALLGIYRANTAIGYDDLADDARRRLVQDYPDSVEAQSVRTEGESGAVTG
ncbi:MAG: outer membrane protein assembly factor BamD [Gemmatimonadota bacterium]|nr:outer membrane protein assembly factor BamD [Gemmatimonadota bacterium]